MRATLLLKHRERQETVRLGEQRIVIGRGITADVQVADPLLSREHCVVESTGNGYVLRDLGSRNGTLVNDRPIKEHHLRPGDVITVGEATLVFTPDEGEEMSVTKVEYAPEATFDEKKTITLAPAELTRSQVFSLQALKLVYDVSTRVADLRDPIRMLQTLAEIVLQAMEASHVCVIVFDEEGEHKRHTRVRSGPPLVNLDLTCIERLKETNLASLYVFPGWVALYVPISYHGMVQGMIYLDNQGTGRVWGEPELQIMTAVGQQVGVIVQNTDRTRLLERNRDHLKEQILQQTELIGGSPVMKRIYEFIRGVSSSPVPVLITGETGTGKELVARSIHFNSGRRDGPFLDVNCAALPRKLVERELFGYEKGAVPGTTGRAKGIFEAASGGTVFLDEIGAIPMEHQERLLKVIDEKRVRRLGAAHDVPADVRLIAACSRDLRELVAAGKFREDLLQRLGRNAIHLPPLRERKEDIQPLARYFIEMFARKMGKFVDDLTDEALVMLQAYRWPGNVRELKNAIERAVILSRGGLLTPEDFPGFHEA